MYFWFLHLVSCVFFWKIEFKDEPALDYGGPARDFFHNLSKAIFDLNFGLFIQTDDYNLSVNPNSGILHGENHLIYFRFVGRMIALCLLHQIVLDCTFSNIFYKSLLNLEIVLEDICSLDMEFYKRDVCAKICSVYICINSLLFIPIFMAENADRMQLIFLAV